MDIKSLKDKILQLAIQGKLVPQDENDEPASVLLEKIKAEKEQLIKDKVIKKENPLPEISEEEKSFDLPRGWEWCRLGDIGISQTGTTPSTSIKEYFGGNIPFIKPADISSKGINYKNDSLTDLGLEKGRKILENSLIMVCIGGSIGKTYYTNRLCSCNQQINALTPLGNINSKLLYYICSSQFFYNNLIKKSTGTATPIIKKSNWELLLIPLPPLEEQKRIVAKVDELFELIDELDNNKQELLENISNTRNKVIQLAIQGKLVEQCEDDEPASVLLERLKAEKEHLIKDKVIKKEKALPEITEEEKSFELPDTWKWCRLGNISAPENYSFVDGPFGSNLKREHYVDYGVRIIQLQNIGEGFWKDYNKIYTSIEKADELIRCNAFPGELVIAKMNPIARATIIPDNDKRYVLCSDCVKLKSYKDIDTGYLKYLMNSSYIKEKASEDGTGTTRQRTSLGKLKLMPIPLPPQEEQKRIVEKVDLIMNYLDTLQQEIESQEIILEDILK